jgi:hypothetical protein
MDQTIANIDDRWAYGHKMFVLRSAHDQEMCKLTQEYMFGTNILSNLDPEAHPTQPPQLLQNFELAGSKSSLNASQELCMPFLGLQTK